MARSLADIFGVTTPRLAVYPGAVQTDTNEVFEEKVRSSVLDQIELGLTTEPTPQGGGK